MARSRSTTPRYVVCNRSGVDSALLEIARDLRVVNASLAAAGTRHALLAARARLEVPHIQRVADELAREAWLIPWYGVTSESNWR